MDQKPDDSVQVNLWGDSPRRITFTRSDGTEVSIIIEVKPEKRNVKVETNVWFPTLATGTAILGFFAWGEALTFHASYLGATDADILQLVSVFLQGFELLGLSLIVLLVFWFVLITWKSKRKKTEKVE